MVRVLFVCMGNICRSPTAHGVFEALVAAEGLSSRVRVESAGTISHHAGEAPDPRSQAHARRRGSDLSRLRARHVSGAALDAADLVLAMDEANVESLRRVCAPEHFRKVRLFLEFAPELGVREVPDPYSGGADGFEHVLDLVEAASRGLLAHLRERLEGRGSRA